MEEEQSNKNKPLSRRERRKLLREEKSTQLGKNPLPIKKWVLGLIVLGTLIYFGSNLAKDVSKPLPGIKVEDLGAEHVTDIAGVEYNSNPPTSGPHFAVWAKPGVYDRLISDGYLIHSMEHGYIIIWYDCDQELAGSNWSFVKYAKAHDEPAKESTDSGELLKHHKYQPDGVMSWFTTDNPPDVEVELPESFKKDSCKNLISKLSVYNDVADRVVVVPRLNMDTPIALTAWGRILKLNSVDDEQIRDFVKSFHNQGPEKTVE